MTFRILMLNTAMTALIALAVPLQLSAQTYTTFDPPNSIQTQPVAINQAGAITGFYAEMNSVNHGFLRAVDGTITTFDAPGAGTGMYQGTTPEAINPGGVITGFYCDATMCHGFVRAKDGTFTTFDPPGSEGTQPASINPAGEITGNYVVPLGTSGFSVPNGFVRSANGAVTIIAPPTWFYETPTAINPAGTTAGTYADANGDAYFLRAKDGAITTFAPPDLFIPLTVSINQQGAAVGFYLSGTLISGVTGIASFLRAPDGNFTVIADPNAGTGFFQGTVAVGINAAEEITGNYSDAIGVSHGFLRTP